MKLKMATVALLVLGLGVQLQVGVARAAAGETLPSPDLSLSFSHRGLSDRQKVASGNYISVLHEIWYTGKLLFVWVFKSQLHFYQIS